MGLERVAYLLQGKHNMYEIDTMLPVIEKAEELTGRRYGADHQDDVRFRVVADHVRSSMMLVGDGVTPGNEGRGYVLRRLLRRAVRSMRLLGTEDRVLPELFPVSRDRMSPGYPQIAADWQRISAVAYAEEDAFRQTLRTGTQIFDLAATEVTAGGGRQISGDKAFALHDTYGFPIDLTLEMASEKGLSVDEDGFRRLMGEQRDRAKADAKAKKSQHADAGAYREIAAAMGTPVRFTGYDEVVSEGVVRGIVGARRHQHRCGARGRPGRDRARPHAVLRRGRRPARRPGRDRARQRSPRRGRRRAVPAHRRRGPPRAGGRG